MAGCDHKRLPLRLARRTQAHAQEVIYGFFEGFSGSAGFLLQPPGYIVIEGKCRSHIMMLQHRHHDVNIMDIMMLHEYSGIFVMVLPSSWLTTDD